MPGIPEWHIFYKVDVMEYNDRVKLIKEVWGEKSSDVIKMLDVIYAHEEDRIKISELIYIFGEEAENVKKAMGFIKYLAGEKQKLLFFEYFAMENGKPVKQLDALTVIELLRKHIYTYNGKDIVIYFQITKDAAWNV